jgi:hypothetical protein
VSEKLTEEMMRLKKHKDALEAFIKGPAHSGYVEARKEELRLVKETIIDIDPMRREDEIEHYKLRGEMRVLQGLVGVFEDALEEVKDRIEELELEGSVQP